MERYYFPKKNKTSSITTAQDLEGSGSRQAQTFPPSTVAVPSEIRQSNVSVSINQTSLQSKSSSQESESESSFEFEESRFDMNSLKMDPGLRDKVSIFHPDVQDEVRRFYLENGPCQPKGHRFPYSDFSGRRRRFRSSWFLEYNWLEYSIEKDAAITNELSLALQRKDQDIVNAMKLVRVSKTRLQEMRDNGWESLLDDVVSSCTKDSIHIPIMHDVYVLPGRSRSKAPDITNLHHFQVELFYTVVDMQMQELNNRFDEVNTRLLTCMTCFSPESEFAAFDLEKLMCLTRFYPAEFGSIHDTIIRQQFIGYHRDVTVDERFARLKGIDELSRVMVETKVHQSYPSVYLLLKLVLTLPVATASVERAFSALSYIKNKLRSRIGDQFANDCLVGYIERDLLTHVENECVLHFFQNMKTRRGCL